jgi:hypothetical protein
MFLPNVVPVFLTVEVWWDNRGEGYQLRRELDRDRSTSFDVSVGIGRLVVKDPLTWIGGVIDGVGDRIILVFVGVYLDILPKVDHQGPLVIELGKHQGRSVGEQYQNGLVLFSEENPHLRPFLLEDGLGLAGGDMGCE